ncbi:GL19054 [Drosophila persimilis]|uniref:GL19054 n=1 Tax=Drosophila persimilis TaxID=7234 RepID=B4G6J6_DROPE|nr:sesquipedalian-1 [Drosophila persimilis]XP_026845034.1 sesquipedalian-1-like [Drosophila persimilis]EDW28221.1 GL19054 [Drosophila persimilis]
MKINEKNLSVFARTPPYDIEGFLNKRGEVNKAFQRRYFVLKGNLLFYFEARTDKEPLGLIIVEGCTIELSNEVDNYCFEIAFNGNRTYILAAEDQESMETWMKALTCAGYEYKRIIVAELQRQLQEIEDSKNKMLGNVGESSQNAITGSKPKPPPRRTNPFNRPAPPPPESALRSGVVMSPMPFVNGYFGSSNARLQQEQLVIKQDGNGNGSPHGTPKAHRRPAPQPVTSAFYIDHQSSETAGRPTVLPRNANNNHIDSAEQKRRQAKAKEDFNRNHEHFRKELMPGIVAYRATQKQPLIQF